MTITADLWWDLYSTQTYKAPSLANISPDPHAEAPTCTVLADDHTQVDGGPVWVQGLAVSTHPVGSVGPDFLSHLVIRQSLSDRLLQGLHPVSLLSVWVCCEAEEVQQRPAVRLGRQWQWHRHLKDTNRVTLYCIYNKRRLWILHEFRTKHSLNTVELRLLC